MRHLTATQFDELIGQVSIKPRIKQDLKFIRTTQHMSAHDWHHTELLAIPDRTGTRGVLLLSTDTDIHIAPYELSRGLTSITGKAQPIICDFCRTWQNGSRSGSITFPRDRRSLNTIGFLCCADLDCSRHVRDKTEAARTSRSQLREDMSPEQRVGRLQERLCLLTAQLQLEAPSIS